MTAIDEKKKNTRYLLNSISGKYYNVHDKAEKINITIVGKRAFKSWANSHEYMTDF